MTSSYDEMRRSRRGYYWGLAKRYVPVVYDSSVVLFRAEEEDLFGLGAIVEKELGWKNLVSGRLETIDIAGTHMGLLKKPHVVTVAAVAYSRINGFAG